MRRIDTSNRLPRAKPVTTVDIARVCGVHPSTVQRALKGSSEVSEATIVRIRQIAADMGYDPARQDAARRLIARRFGQVTPNQTVALFFPSEFAEIPYFHFMFQGIMEVLNEIGYDLLTVSSLHQSGGNSLSPSIVRGLVDGALIFSPNPERALPLVENLRLEHSFDDRPIVSLISPVPTGSAVLADDFGGGYQAATHLLRLGHRHLLHLYCDLRDYVSQERTKGYRRACEEFGLDPTEHLHTPPYRAEGWVGWGEPVLEALMLDRRLTGILAANDQAAVDIGACLATAGWRVPEDISLVGFDDADPTPGPGVVRWLTTVRVPLTEIGREAARLVVAEVTGETAEQGTIVLPVELVERSSSAPPRKS